MFAQLVGLPGAGKSTIAERLERLYPQQFERVVVDYQSNLALLSSRPVQTLTTLATLAPIIPYALLAARPHLGFRERLFPVSSLLNLLLTFRQLKREPRPSGQIRLFDEFVHQRALSLFGYSRRRPSRSMLRAFLWLLRNDSVLPVFIATDVEQAMRRAQERTAGWPKRLTGMDPMTLEETYRRQAMLLEDLRMLSPDAISIDNRQGVTRCAEEIRAHLEQRLARSSRSVAAP